MKKINLSIENVSHLDTDELSGTSLSGYIININYRNLKDRLGEHNKNEYPSWYLKVNDIFIHLYYHEDDDPRKDKDEPNYIDYMNTIHVGTKFGLALEKDIENILRDLGALLHGEFLDFQEYRAYLNDILFR